MPLKNLYEVRLEVEEHFSSVRCGNQHSCLKLLSDSNQCFGSGTVQLGDIIKRPEHSFQAVWSKYRSKVQHSGWVAPAGVDDKFSRLFPTP